MKNKCVVVRKPSHVGDIVLAKSPVRESDAFFYRLHTSIKSNLHVMALSLDQVHLKLLQENTKCVTATFTDLDADIVELVEAVSSKVLAAIFDNRSRVFTKENMPRSVDKLRTFFESPLKMHDRIGRYQLVISSPAFQDSPIPYDATATYDVVLALNAVVFTKGGFHLQWRILSVKPSQSANIAFEFDQSISLPDEDDLAELQAKLTRSIAHLRQRIQTVADSLVVDVDHDHPASVQSILMLTRLMSDTRKQLELVAFE